MKWKGHAAAPRLVLFIQKGREMQKDGDKMSHLKNGSALKGGWFLIVIGICA